MTGSQTMVKTNSKLIGIEFSYKLLQDHQIRTSALICVLIKFIKRILFVGDWDYNASSDS